MAGSQKDSCRDQEFVGSSPVEAPAAEADLEIPALISGGGVTEIIGAASDGLATGFRRVPDNHSAGEQHVVDMPPAAGAQAAVDGLARALWLMSLLTLIFDVATVIYKPATAAGHIFRGNKIMYYAVLAAIFGAGVFEACTAMWASRAPHMHRPRRSSFARAILCCSIGPLVLIVGLASFRFIED